LDNVVSNIKNYLKTFKKKKQSKKALVIYDSEDYLSRVKMLEAICEDLDYNIIRIDQIDKNRNLKLNEISEAFQSNRISSLDERKSEKLRILEKIVNNNPAKISNLIVLAVINYVI
jgi:hypothetical protein